MARPKSDIEAELFKYQDLLSKNKDRADQLLYGREVTKLENELRQFYPGSPIPSYKSSSSQGQNNQGSQGSQGGQGSNNQAIDPISIFKDKSYANTPELKRIVDSYVGYAAGHPVDVGGEGFRNAIYGQINGYVDNFSSQFRDKVGRDPNNEEIGKFLSYIETQSPATQNAQIFGEQIGQKTTGFIGSNFQRTAEEEAQKRLEEQSIAAVAPNSAFDVWQNSYKNSINDVEKSLQDYQTRLFEKIRPNLITSLQAQGLLNSGALNEAFAGTAKDFASENSNYLASARGAINQDIANQKYALQSAPSSYQIQNTVGGPERLYNGGQQALQNVWQATMANLEANNARNLYDYQNANQPRTNALAQYGGLILGGMAGGFGQGMGARLAKG